MHWRTACLRRLVAADAASAAAAAAAAGAVVARQASPVVLAEAVVALSVAWVAALAMTGAYGSHLLEHGPQSSRRVGYAAVLLVVAAATISWGLQRTIPRGFVLITVVVAGAAALASRHGHRVWLRRRRHEGECMRTTLLVGAPEAVASLHEELRRTVDHGHRVIGCCLPSADQRWFDGMPVLGDLGRVTDVLQLHRVDTVAVVPAEELDGEALDRLAGDLASAGVTLLLSPALADAAGPRVRTRPSWVLPLLQADRPDLQRVRRVTTAAVLRAAALLALVLMLPVLLVIAAAIKATSSGAVLVRQPHTSASGRVVSRLRFRTTVTRPGRPADRLPGPTIIHGDDPRRVERATAVGSFLHRHCLDELPQMVAVLRREVAPAPRRQPVPARAERDGAGRGRS